MITDGTAKWHYTALKSVKTSDGSVRPIKSYSRLMNGYSSKHKMIFIVIIVEILIELIEL